MKDELGKLKLLTSGKQARFNTDNIPSGYEILTLKTFDLVAGCKKHNIYQRSDKVKSYDHNLPFDGDVSRVESLANLVIKGGLLEPISMEGHLNKVDGSAGFSIKDGRHRLMLMRIMVEVDIVCLIKSSEVNTVLLALGINRWNKGYF